MGPPRKSLRERFSGKFRIDVASGCWLWTGSKHEGGYGLLRRGGSKQGHIGAHRASWLIHRGEIPDGMVVCHKCDVPPCVNPDHLFIGTDADNLDDCRKKGRLRLRNYSKVQQVDAA